MATKGNSKVSPAGVGGMSIPRGPNGECGSVPSSVPMKGATISKPSKGKGYVTSQKFK